MFQYQQQLPNNIAVSKHHLFTGSFILGAKSVSIEQLEVTTIDGSTLLRQKEGGLVLVLTFLQSMNRREGLEKQLTIDARYSGGDPDINAAEDFLGGIDCLVNNTLNLYWVIVSIKEIR